VNKFNEQYQDGTGFERLKAHMDSADPADVRQVQNLLHAFLQTEMDKQVGISNPVGYQDPNLAYTSANVTQVNRNEKLNEIFEDYADIAQGINKTYGSTREHKGQLQNSYESEKDNLDTHTYFTKAGIRYHHKATMSQFEIDRKKELYNRAWNSTSSREETAKDYELYVPFFWRGDDE
jgi:conjugal transfer mating pair stabilization protein TraG